jgi:predicted nucleic acid-binding protein
LRDRVGDCWLLAFAAGIQAALVTFDKALYELARQQSRAAVLPG